MKTALLLITLTALLILVGWTLDVAFHTSSFIYVFFIISMGMNVLQYWYSDKLVLTMHRARAISPSDKPQLHEMIDRLSRQAQIPKPAVYLVPSDVPNAFATGRNPQHAAIAVTEGILRVMDERQLEGVLAHELAHVKNRDTLISTVAAMMAGTIMMLSHVARWGAIFAMGSRDRDGGANAIGALLVAILAPIAAVIIQLAISRSREYKADEQGAAFSRNPLGLADALATIENVVKRHQLKGAPTMSHLYIVNPFRGKSIANLFSTHPSTEERIKRLHDMARKMGIYH